MLIKILEVDCKLIQLQHVLRNNPYYFVTIFFHKK